MSRSSNSTDYSNATDHIFLDCEDQPEGVFFWICVTAASFVFGFPGAVSILLDMFQKGRKGTPFTPNDVFIINLTAMDGVYLFFLHPELYNHFVWHNKTYTELIAFLYSFTLCGRPLFITCICLDSYLAVVHPVTYRARKSLTPRVLMTVGVWTLTVAYGCCLVSITTAEFDLFTIHIIFSLTLPVIVFCDLTILWSLKRSSPGGRDIHPQKKRALKIIINNMVITFISYFPPVIAQLVTELVSVDENTIRCLVITPLLGITIAGSTVSVILYLINLGKLDWLKCCKQK